MEPFHYDTYVAFMDIAGFKKRNAKEMRSSLKTFYQVVFDQTESIKKDYWNQTCSINTIALSDSALFFVRHGGDEDDDDMADILFKLLRRINIGLIKHGIITFTGVSYGDFHYYSPREREDLRKAMLFGDAFINAYTIAEKDNKIPGLITVHHSVAKRIDQDLQGYFSTLIKKYRRKKRFFWMLQPNMSLERFTEVENLCNSTLYGSADDSRYSKWVGALKNHISQRN